MPNERLIEVFGDLERTLRAFIHRNSVTAAEYLLAVETIVASVEAGEGTMIFDTFLEADARDVSNDPAGSPNSMAGPFYRPDAPVLERPYVLPQRPDEKGQPLLFRGRIESTDHQPIRGAEIDMWQADADGNYSQFEPGLPQWNLRGRFTTADDGTFEVRSILPPPYQIPTGGPTGAVLAGLGRHAFRPAHLHVKLRAPGHHELTSQLYFEGGEYLDDDAINGVRPGLILPIVREAGAVIAEYNFVLVPMDVMSPIAVPVDEAT